MSDTSYHCEHCGEPLTRRLIDSYAIDALVGLDGVVLQGMQLLACSLYPKHDSVIMEGEIIKGSMEVAAQRLIKYAPKWSGQELRFVRKFLDYSQVKLGEFLGVDRNTIGRWEKDEIEIPEATALVMRGRAIAFLRLERPDLVPAEEVGRWYATHEPRPADFYPMMVRSEDLSAPQTKPLASVVKVEHLLSTTHNSEWGNGFSDVLFEIHKGQDEVLFGYEWALPQPPRTVSFANKRHEPSSLEPSLSPLLDWSPRQKAVS